LHLSALLDRCTGGPPCQTGRPKAKESMVVTGRLFFELIEALPSSAALGKAYRDWERISQQHV
jgi:hypothetical protein